MKGVSATNKAEQMEKEMFRDKDPDDDFDEEDSKDD